MPIEDSLESARQACLKQVFGAPLTADEEQLVRRFVATDEGRDYRKTAQEMRLRLKEVVEVRPRPVEAAEMSRRFEEMIRQKARLALRSMWKFMVVLLVWFAASLALIRMGPGFACKGWFSLVAVLLLAWAGVALWKKNREMARDPNLILGMRRDQELLRQFRTQLNGWILGTLFFGGMAVAWYLDSGTDGLRELLVPMLLAFLTLVLTPIWMKVLRRKERDLWDWWEGTARK